jgi:hypothetical protein
MVVSFGVVGAAPSHTAARNATTGDAAEHITIAETPRFQLLRNRQKRLD